MTVIFDYDYIKYGIASAAETRTIKVIHNISKIEKTFPTRTDFYGHWAKKSGGWLEKANIVRSETGKDLLKVCDFTIEDIQTAQPLEFALSSVKHHINNVLENLGETRYYGYIGRGDSWRVEASTLIKYKGNRENLIKPLLLKGVEEYLIKNHEANIVTHLEADDMCVIDSISNKEIILVGSDKDYFGCPLKFYIHGKMDSPQDIQGFGDLFVNDKGHVKGYGYIWWLFQVMSGDAVDNYFANSASTIKWGDKSAYKLLKPCKNEVEAWRAVIDGYKLLYPNKIDFTGWRGDILEVDWKYVLNENCVLSKMMETLEYKFNLEKELEKFGVSI